MSLNNNYEVSVEDKEKFLRIANVFLFYYEVYSGKDPNVLAFDDPTEMLFSSDRFMFGRLVLQLFSVFNVTLTHAPLQEFKQFPRVIDLLLYIYENGK